MTQVGVVMRMPPGAVTRAVYPRPHLPAVRSQIVDVKCTFRLLGLNSVLSTSFRVSDLASPKHCHSSPASDGSMDKTSWIGIVLWKLLFT